MNCTGLFAATLLIGLGYSAVAMAEPVSMDRAEKLYDTYCAQCHGMSRNGKGINTVGLSVQPRDHTDTKAMSDLPDDQIRLVIEEGGLAVNKSILMPAWGEAMSAEEITAMVSYLRKVCKCGN
jgi:cytochrome c oxidase cbb3-type subunit 3